MEEENNIEYKVYTESTAMEAIEAMLFAAGHPLSFEQIAEVLHLPEETTRTYAERLRDSYYGHGIQLLFLGDGCQLVTREAYIDEIRTVLGIRRGGNLSRSSLETLAIVAYNQPVTRSYIDEVRGVDSSYAVSSLIEKGLLEVKGHLDAPGHPTLLGTTDSFLRVFGIETLEELPAPDRFLEADSAEAESAAEMLTQTVAKD